MRRAYGDLQNGEALFAPLERGSRRERIRSGRGLPLSGPTVCCRNDGITCEPQRRPPEATGVELDEHTFERDHWKFFSIRHPCHVIARIVANLALTAIQVPCSPAPAVVLRSLGVGAGGCVRSRSRLARLRRKTRCVATPRLPHFMRIVQSDSMVIFAREVGNGRGHGIVLDHREWSLRCICGGHSR